MEDYSVMQRHIERGEIMNIEEKVEKLLSCQTVEVNGKEELNAILLELQKYLPKLIDPAIDDIMYELRNNYDNVKYIFADYYMTGDYFITFALDIEELPLISLNQDHVYAYVANLDHPEFSEFGSVTFKKMGNAYVRVF